MIDRQLEVFFRYDDLAARSWFSPQAGNAQFAILEAFQRAQAPLSAAIIPAAENERGTHPIEDDPMMCAALSESVRGGFLDPALHGFSHRDRGRRGGGRSELIGEPVERQRSLLGEGKRRLEALLSRNIDVFVPPWNTYDSGTLQALSATGFSVLSASTRLVARGMAQSRMAWLPGTVSLQAAIEVAGEVARAPLPSGTLMGVVLHVFDFSESGDPRAWTSVQSIRELVQRLRDLGARIVTISEIARRSASLLTLSRYRANAFASRIAASPRLSFAIPKSRGQAFSSVYWPERAIWQNLIRRCGPFSGLGVRSR